MSCDFHTEETRRARKDYTCGYCEQPILSGSQHCYERGAFEGVFWSERSHSECRAAKVWQWRQRDCCQDFDWGPFRDSEHCDGFDDYQDLWAGFPAVRPRLRKLIVDYVQDRLDDEPGAFAWLDRWLIVEPLDGGRAP